MSLIESEMEIDVSNFCLVCYYDKETNKLARIENYTNNSSDIEADVKSYEYGYNAVVIKPEQLMGQLQQLKFENKTLKEKLEKVKSTLELYANSKIGALQDNGTYRIDCGGDAVIGSFRLQTSNTFGLPSIFTYDPRPAKEALNILGEDNGN